MTNEEIIQKVKEEVKLRALSPNTEEEYLLTLQAFLRYFQNRSLETMGELEIRQFLLYQIDLKKSAGSVNMYNSALRFVFGAVMQRTLNCRMIPRQRYCREFPAIMDKDDIVRFFNVIDNLRDKTIFETIYGGGLRISEIVKLRVQDIDSKQMRIFIIKVKVKKTVTHYYQREIWNFYVPIGKNIVLLTLMGICFIPEAEKTVL
jgi:site-specific recombinase XerD